MKTVFLGCNTRPEIEAIVLKRSSRSIRSTNFGTTTPMSSAQALLIPALPWGFFKSNLFRRATRNGSIAIAKRVPERGHPCKIPQRK